MTYILLLVLGVICIELFLVLKVRKQIEDIIAVTRGAMAVLASSELDDEVKESRIRRCSLELFKATFLFLFKFFGIVAILCGVYFAFAVVFPDQRESVDAALTSITAILLLSLLAIAYIYFRNVIVRRL